MRKHHLRVRLLRVRFLDADGESVRESASESGWDHLRTLEKRPVKYILRESLARESACESVLKTASESARQSASSESDWEDVWESASDESGRENV